MEIIMKHKTAKGSFGYLVDRRKKTLIRTILFFGISLAVFLIGFLTTGSNQNYLTIAAVLGCLPASKSLVNTIMFYRYQGCSHNDHKKIQSHTGGLRELYDLVFTSYEKNFDIHHMVLSGGSIIGYTANTKCDTAGCEKHLRAMLAQNGFSKIHVKIFQDLTKYCSRLDQLQENLQDASDSLPPDTERDENVIALLCSISL